MKNKKLIHILYFFIALLVGSYMTNSVVVRYDRIIYILTYETDDADEHVDIPQNDDHTDFYRRFSQHNLVVKNNKCITLFLNFTNTIKKQPAIERFIKSYFFYARSIIIGLPVTVLIFPFNSFW